MPVAKNPFIRYKIINACLTSKAKPYPTKEELKAALAREDIRIGSRSLENDIEAMRFDNRLGYHAPIAFCRRNRGYYYTDPDYTIERLPLSSDELEAFAVVVDSFKRFRGAEALHPVDGVFDKLDKLVMQQRKPANGKETYPVVDFEKMPFSKGVEHFDTLHRAIRKRQPILIDYKKFDEKKPTQYLFHPYLLKEYRFRWYVLGYSEKRKSKVVLALDRIEHIASVRNKVFREQKVSEISNYFDHTIGVTFNPIGVKEIKVWFSPSQGNYLKTQHLHNTQQIISDDASGLVATFQLVPNYELAQTLLALGPEVKVLEPRWLRNQMKDMLAATLELYDK
ncbi:MAG TPA: WYL domain-containing protein [Ohtaekwangia sp.]|nr:WYL domain-containing protein [Ohtaekwangia sp.]